MKRSLKSCLACFMALAVMVSYSFSPQILTAFAVTGEDSQTVAEEQKATDKQAEPESEATESNEATEEEEQTEQAEPDTPSENEEETEAASDSEQDADASEETEEPEAEDEEEEDQYPAVSFSESVGRMKVKISAPEGALPEGATVKIVSVKSSRPLTSLFMIRMGMRSNQIRKFRSVLRLTNSVI